MCETVHSGYHRAHYFPQTNPCGGSHYFTGIIYKHSWPIELRIWSAESLDNNRKVRKKDIHGVTMSCFINFFRQLLLWWSYKRKSWNTTEQKMHNSQIFGEEKEILGKNRAKLCKVALLAEKLSTKFKKKNVIFWWLLLLVLIAYLLKSESQGHSTNNQSHRNWHHWFCLSWR